MAENFSYPASFGHNMMLRGWASFLICLTGSYGLGQFDLGEGRPPSLNRQMTMAAVKAEITKLAKQPSRSAMERLGYIVAHYPDLAERAEAPFLSLAKLFAQDPSVDSRYREYLSAGTNLAEVFHAPRLLSSTARVRTILAVLPRRSPDGELPSKSWTPTPDFWLCGTLDMRPVDFLPNLVPLEPHFVDQAFANSQFDRKMVLSSALGPQSSRAMEPHLHRLISDPSSAVRLEALSIAARLGGNGYGPIFEAASQDPYAWIRQVVAQSVASIPMPYRDRIAARLLRDENPKIRRLLLPKSEG